MQDESNNTNNGSLSPEYIDIIFETIRMMDLSFDEVIDRITTPFPRDPEEPFRPERWGNLTAKRIARNLRIREASDRGVKQRDIAKNEGLSFSSVCRILKGER